MYLHIIKNAVILLMGILKKSLLGKVIWSNMELIRRIRGCTESTTYDFEWL